MRHHEYRLRILAGVLLLCLSLGCGDTKRPVDTGLTSQVMQCPDGPHHVMNCAQMYEQYKRDFHVGLQVLNKIGAQVHLPVRQLIELDALTAELMLYRQNLCQSYNSCILTRGEYVAEQRKLMQLQFDLRRVVGIARQAGFAEATPGVVPTAPDGTVVVAGGTPGLEAGGLGTAGTSTGGLDAGGFGTAGVAVAGTPGVETGSLGTTGLETAGLELRGVAPSPVSGNFEQKNAEEKILELVGVITTNMRQVVTRGQQAASAPQNPGTIASATPTTIATGQTVGNTAQSAVAATQTALSRPSSLEQYVAQALSQLMSQAAQTAPEQAGRKIVVGNFPARDGGYETPFSRYLATMLHEQLSAAGTYSVVPRQAFRGLAVVAKPKQPAALARAAGAQLVLHGEHLRTPGNVTTRLLLTDTETSQPLASAETVIPAALIPAAYPAQVANATQVEQNAQVLQELGAPSSGSLQVEVWTDRGSGASYHEGEEVVIYLRANKDCHVRLFYVDAANQTVQIFPNAYHTDDRLKARQEIVIPTEAYGFRFVVTPPFGVERVVAMVSEVPMPDVTGQNLGDGRTLVAGSVRGIVDVTRTLYSTAATRRGIGIVSNQPETAWDDVMLTTLAQRPPS